ncbi:MAG: patatin-like phospholipase family protein [Gammaproteobacteria bacterium]|nr:patatin-like phospholipase family protein [Gammaproteobacteria bacterium]
MFKILSLDGGGARGAFIAGFLLELEEKNGEPLIDYFDLIAGTSTGSVIAVLLGIGHSMKDIEVIYSSKLKTVFSLNEPYFSSLLGRVFTFGCNPFIKYFTGVHINELFRSRYSFEGVISLLKKYTDGIKMASINRTRLVVPSTNLIQGKPYVFKTSHLPHQSDSYDFYTLDVILASAAAPGYFDPITLPGHGIFSDGGIWANNPGLVAYAEAVKIATECTRDIDPKFDPSKIQMLSVGTGHASDNFSPPYAKAGVRWWSRRLMDLMFESQTQSSNYYLEQLLHKNYFRVNYERPNPSWGQLDDYKHAKDMSQMGRLIARKRFSIIKELFLSEKVKPFVPY